MVAEGYAKRMDIAAEPAAVLRALTKDIDRWWTTSAQDASATGSTVVVRKNSVTHSGREEVFMMQPAKDRIGTDRI